MKKIYPVFFPLIFILASCSKDFLKSYDKRITGGTWELYDVNNFGLGSRYSSPFVNGWFTFESSGEVTYTNPEGEVYTGDWEIRKDWLSNEEFRSLHITVQNPQTGKILSEHFDRMEFTGTNRFKAFIYSVGRTYTYKFKR
jgi:hypothetical protein